MHHASRLQGFVSSRPLRAVLCTLLLCATPASAGVQIETVALTGDPAPGTAESVVFDAFELIPGLAGIHEGPVMSPDGRVAFAAVVAGPDVSFANDNGIWFEDGSELALAAREGNAAPGRAGRVFNAFGYLPAWVPGIGLALTGSTLVEPPGAPGSPQSAIWVGTPGDFELVLHRGDGVPDQEPSVTFQSGTASDANAAGEVAIAASLTGTLDALFVWTPPEPPDDTGSLRSVVVEGDPAPGTQLAFARIPSFFSPTPYPARLADDGSVAFQAALEGAQAPEGVWQETDGGLALVAVEGGTAPDTGDAVYDSFDEVNRSASGRISFFAFTSGGSVDAGLYGADPEDVALDVAAGDPAPGSPAETLSLFQPAPALIRGGGVRTFVGRVSGQDAIFVGAPGALRELMRQGATTPPGGPSGAVYFWGSGSTRRLVVDLDAGGRVAVLTGLSGTSASEDLGLFLADAGGTPQWVTHEGDTLTVAPGDERIVADLGIVASSEAPYRALSDAGELAFRATFTDGSAGVFIARLPEPGGEAAGAVAVWVLSLCARGAHAPRPRDRTA